ncbi:MAG: lamin tail domain-containing protein [Gammaproteobacteria bacterium]
MTKILPTALAAVALTALPVVSAQAALVVTEVFQQATAGTANTINGDWWELTNTGAGAVDLTGYKWADTEDAIGGPTPSPNLFPSLSIAPGQSIILIDEQSSSAAAFRANWGLDASVVILFEDQMTDDGDGDSFSGLSSNDDAVFFYAPDGTLLSSYEYGAGTRGVSFGQSGTGVDLGLSVVGQNGAKLALNGDIGSPGAAVVPVPGAVWLFAPALAALAGRRRRG